MSQTDEQPAKVEPEDLSHHRRLLEGMAQAVAARGYADTTIADVVREAGVSRRTFYEHFSTKAECLVALYAAASHNALNVLRESIDPGQAWQAQVERALTAYLGFLARSPVLMRTLYVEILGLGRDGLLARRRVNQEIADFMIGVINCPNPGGDEKHALAPEMAMAIVGGINELVLQYIERGHVEHLGELVKPASLLVRAVTHSEGRNA